MARLVACCFHKNLHKSYRWFVVSFPIWEMGKNRYILNMPCKPYLSIAVAGSSLYTLLLLQQQLEQVKIGNWHFVLVIKTVFEKECKKQQLNRNLLIEQCDNVLGEKLILICLRTAGYFAQQKLQKILNKFVCLKYTSVDIYQVLLC